MRTFSARVLAAVFVGAWIAAGGVALGQPAPSAPIGSPDEFNKAVRNAGALMTGPTTNRAASLAAASELLARAVAWAREHPGANHSDLVQALFEGGEFAALGRDFSRAESLYRDALATLDGTGSPDQAMVYQVLRRVLAATWHNGHVDLSIEAAKRLSRLSSAQLQKDIGFYLSAPDTLPPNEVDFFERQAQEPEDVTFRALRWDLDRIIAALINVPDARNELAEAVVVRQAAIQDAVAGLQVVLSAPETGPPAIPDALTSYVHSWATDPPGGPLAPLNRLRANAAALSQLAYADPHITPDRLPKPLQLQHERTELTRRMANRMRVSRKVASLEDIRQAMPANALLLAYAVYSRPPTAQERRGENRYLVVALSAKGVEEATDLGPVAKVDALIAAACRAILKDIEEASHCSGQPSPEPAATTTLAEAGKKLYGILLGSVTQALARSAQVIVSPDGALDFFPFEVLAGQDDKYLISSHLVSYVQSPREIAVWNAVSASHGPPVIIADPDYDLSGAAKPTECGEVTRGPPRKLRASESLQGFAPLCGTSDEAKFVHDALPDAKILTRGDATEEAVKELFGPRILHLATHGFAAEKLSWPPTWFAPQFRMWWDLQDFAAMDDDPMLHGGLVLAGANIRRSPGGHGTGLLSAREASLLNLNGTQLVVLSACDSGLGLARAGDGVLGLRRAFAQAGARAQTFSLWPVGDATGAEFMRRYYRLLADGTPNAEALARVKRAFLTQGGTEAEPWAWAVFVGYGYPGPLAR